jgi:hypothetical protein
MLTLSVIALFALGALAQPTIVSAQYTEAIESDPDIQVGVLFSVKCTGLTNGYHYRLDVIHSAGNITDVLTATGSVGYAELLIEDEDSDGIVILALSRADSSGAYMEKNAPTDNSSTYVTSLVSLKSAQDYINPAFFLLILTPFLIIMVVYAIAKKFVKTG